MARARTTLEKRKQKQLARILARKVRDTNQARVNMARLPPGPSMENLEGGG